MRGGIPICFPQVLTAKFLRHYSPATYVYLFPCPLSSEIVDHSSNMDLQGTKCGASIMILHL